MRTAKVTLILMLVVAWLVIVGSIILTSSIGFSMSGGLIPNPSVSGVGSLPLLELGVATLAFLVGIVATEFAL